MKTNFFMIIFGSEKNSNKMYYIHISNKYMIIFSWYAWKSWNSERRGLQTNENLDNKQFFFGIHKIFYSFLKKKLKMNIFYLLLFIYCCVISWVKDSYSFMIKYEFEINLNKMITFLLFFIFLCFSWGFFSWFMDNILRFWWFV